MSKTKIKAKDDSLVFNRMLTAVIVLSAILLAVGIIAVFLVFFFIVAAIESGQPALVIPGILLGALLILADGGVAIAWMILVIICLIKSDNVKGLESKNFKIAFGLILGVCAAIIITNFILYFVNVPNEAIEALSSLQSASLIATIVVSAYFKVQIKNKRA